MGADGQVDEEVVMIGADGQVVGQRGTAEL